MKSAGEWSKRIPKCFHLRLRLQSVVDRKEHRQSRSQIGAPKAIVKTPFDSTTRVRAAPDGRASLGRYVRSAPRYREPLFPPAPGARFEIQRLIPEFIKAGGGSAGGEGTHIAGRVECSKT
ncbi:hypothetical protein EVAR_89807_1 [Eumeta japonica]|uniref:Uncharacterized protein n=1 Tax=Eumeta variegata TaxID=151549 RepID=A0A4C1YL95_EUMVA|nr:hypothetical protein EVAR_89807_1 [Eumeta japonica]